MYCSIGRCRWRGRDEREAGKPQVEISIWYMMVSTKYIYGTIAWRRIYYLITLRMGVSTSSPNGGGSVVSYREWWWRSAAFTSVVTPNGCCCCCCCRCGRKYMTGIGLASLWTARCCCCQLLYAPFYSQSTPQISNERTTRTPDRLSITQTSDKLPIYHQ